MDVCEMRSPAELPACMCWLVVVVGCKVTYVKRCYISLLFIARAVISAVRHACPWRCSK